MTIKSPKKLKFIPAKIVGSQNNKLMHISRIKKKWKTSFPRMEKYRFTNHGKNKSSFTLHAKQKCPFRRHGKSIGDPHCCLGTMQTSLDPSAYNRLLLLAKIELPHGVEISRILKFSMK